MSDGREAAAADPEAEQAVEAAAAGAEEALEKAKGHWALVRQGFRTALAANPEAEAEVAESARAQSYYSSYSSYITFLLSSHDA